MDDLKYDSEKLAIEAQEYIDIFKDKLKDICNQVLDDVYCNTMPHIESDTWTNYRNYLSEGFKKDKCYDYALESYGIDVRRLIFLEHKDQIISLINNDLLERVKILEDRVKEYENQRWT